ncbi:MAG: DUF3419 family protein [Desertifilum sp. SIO1I2]|nr:DUF3419 family protein [Desertifilum sp. SIO1I2]
MICSPASEIAFSQTREDPNIELQIIEQLATNIGHSLRVLLIASGGCTALSLLVHPAIASIEAVDLNPAQLHLVELRRQALLHLDLNAQLQFIGADLAGDESERLRLYQQLRSHLPTPTQAFWDNRQSQIAFGVNRVGRFEQLFHELSEQFNQLGLDPIENPEIAVNHPQWSAIFEKVFERQKLTRTFGEAAVNYSMDRSFGEHFADVFALALQRFSPQDNYFLTQVWRDSYSDNSKPLYLQAEAQEIIRQQGCHRLHLHQGLFVEQMLKLAQLGKFDLIQFSNISDWMPLPDLHKMLANAFQCLNPGGALLGRRLNGDRHLATVMAEHLEVDDSLSTQLLKLDRSFFYREVVVGFH